jgi:hypothetical protein
MTVLKKFPTIVCDNFFSDVDTVRNFGLSLKFFPSSGSFPGERSDDLSKLNPVLGRAFLQKIFSLYWNDPSKITCDAARIKFQKIPSFSKKETDFRNQGWIHQDKVVNRNKLAGVIYLTPNPRLDTGTSIFRPKVEDAPELLNYKKGENSANPNKEKSVTIENWHLEYKVSSNGVNKAKELAKQGFEIDYDKLEEYKNKWNGCFEPVTQVNNVYNRLISFDGNEYHAANSYYNTDQERLIIVFFIDNVKGGTMPKDRVVKDNLTEIINASNKVTV